MVSNLLWVVPAAPLLAFCLITAFLRRPQKLAGYVSILAIAASFVVSVGTLLEGLNYHPKEGAEHAIWHVDQHFHWLAIGPMSIDLSLFVDPIGAVMLVVVTFVSMLVQIYSLGYMVEHGEMDPGFSRFYSYLSLFTFSMLLLLLANNFVQLFAGWELVGLCSYLLVGFWYHKPEAAEAAKKAFLTTRFGDLGFLIGILIVFTVTGSFLFADVEKAATGGQFAGPILAVAMVLLFCGAIGKSAQFPLHVWLPDAMEGPTPVSALIHAATMVAAGVYMVARLFVLFEHAPAAMEVVAWIGAITALFAATHGLVMRDIKRVLAYSTVSQLGYMMMALGMGGLAAGVFHLTTHAFFKALLFLGSGSVIHGSGEQDMFKLGGLRRDMPITRWTFLIGSLALAGIPPLAGFWSKDEILVEAWNHQRWLMLGIGVLTAFLTAFYIFRAYFLTFHGERRFGWVDPDATHALDAAKFSIDTAHTDDAIARVAYKPHEYYLATHGPAAEGHDHAHGGDVHASGHGTLAEHPQPGSPVQEAHSGVGDHGHHPLHATHGSEGESHGHHSAHESPATMTGPLVLLSLFAIFVGFAGAPFFGNPFAAFVTGHPHEAQMNYPLAIGTSVLALVALWLAHKMYNRDDFQVEPLVDGLGPFYTLFARRYYVDDVYNWAIGFFILGGAAVLAWIDRNIIDGIVNLVGKITAWVGNVFSRAQTGRAPNYALVAFAGIAALAFILATGVR